MLMNYWSENVDKYEREKILEGIHTFIGLSFQEFYEDTRKALTLQWFWQGKGKRKPYETCPEPFP